jgi:hypothetical protein
MPCLQRDSHSKAASRSQPLIIGTATIDAFTTERIRLLRTIGRWIDIKALWPGISVATVQKSDRTESMPLGDADRTGLRWHRKLQQWVRYGLLVLELARPFLGPPRPFPIRSFREWHSLPDSMPARNLASVGAILFRGKMNCLCYGLRFASRH